jgi:hypothetical protein
MMIRTRTEMPMGSKALAFSFLLTALMAAMPLAASKPAHAAIFPFVVNQAGDDAWTFSAKQRGAARAAPPGRRRKMMSN